jgi:hypothetical protein
VTFDVRRNRNANKSGEKTHQRTFSVPGINKEIAMQILKCNIGIWQVEAKIQDVGHNQLLAAVSARDKHGRGKRQSNHIVVFDHRQGRDPLDETRDEMRRVLKGAY